jgi:hypothetical protein
MWILKVNINTTSYKNAFEMGFVILNNALFNLKFQVNLFCFIGFYFLIFIILFIWNFWIVLSYALYLQTVGKHL